MNFFAENDYKKLFLRWMSQQPKQGRGLMSALAVHLEVHSTLLSLIFKRDSHLTSEQAVLTAQFMNLNVLETDYFCTLVQLERVAKPQARKYYENKLKQLRSESENLKKSLEAQSDLTEESYATFFSHWMYTWMFLKVATQPGISKSALLKNAVVDTVLQESVLQFLLDKSVLKEKDMKLYLGSRQIYVGRESVFLRNHLMNWRQKATEQIRDHFEIEDLFFSSPVALTKADKKIVSQKIREFLSEFKGVTDPSDSEIICCLNIDWFEVS